MCKTTAQTMTARPESSPTASTSSTASFGSRTRDSPLLILKVGTSSLMLSDEDGFRVNLANLARLVDTIAALKRDGYQVVLVSSGAVGMGCIKLNLTKRPTCIRTKQAVAAAGQSHLVRIYEDLFGALNLQVAQLLLNQSDFLDQDHWSNIKGTINECLALGVVPIINENDSTNTAEMRFGDNDNLAALTAVQLEADGLFLCTDVDYLYTANPRSDPDAKALRVVDEPWALQVDTSAEGSGMGTGGMATKILAARTASTAGVPCGLINGQHPERIQSFMAFGLGGRSRQEEASLPLPEGTFFRPMPQDGTVGDNRRWILSLPTSAELCVDDDCARELAGKKNLSSHGIYKVEGKFEKNDCVKLMHNGTEIGRGLVNFTSEELEEMLGSHSGDESSSSSGCSSFDQEACDFENVVLTVGTAAFEVTA